MPSEAASLQALRVFLECVGSQLSCLDLLNVHFHPTDPAVITAIAENCVNLKQLLVSSAELNDQGLAHLLGAIEDDGPFGAKLLALELSDNYFSDAMYERLANSILN